MRALTEVDCWMGQPESSEDGARCKGAGSV